MPDEPNTPADPPAAAMTARRSSNSRSTGHGAGLAAPLFLRNGYPGTSMDDVAALAAVSKQTVYKHFADKERLFSEVVRVSGG